MKPRWLAGLLSACVLAGSASLSHAQTLVLTGNGNGQTLYALTGANELLQFNANRPARILRRVAVGGLQLGEELLCIDFRPANGMMYGVGSSNRVYVINPNTGAAQAVGAQPFAPGLIGSELGCDVNPVVDRLRVVSNAGQNLRLNMDTGMVVDGNPNVDGVQTDGPLAYNATDPNAGIQPVVAEVAYTNNDNNPATGTELFDIDRRLDVLAKQDPPNAGTLNTRGSLRVDAITELAGFDISPAGVGYAALIIQGRSVNPQGLSRLAVIDLTSGRVSDRGVIGTSTPIRGLAAPAP
ncbi:MAG: DUF4394 domain-containing protein [Gammaproteobacteria bacterium]